MPIEVKIKTVEDIQKTTIIEETDFYDATLEDGTIAKAKRVVRSWTINEMEQEVKNLTNQKVQLDERIAKLSSYIEDAKAQIEEQLSNN